MGLSTAIGLASSAGLNAYIPLLAYGLLARFTDIVSLPPGWQWLADPWLLGVVGVLLVIELIADKIPAVDSVNDIIQTLIRPTSGGLMFASVFGDQTVDSAQPFSEPQTWLLVGVGFVVALVMHLMKATSRPVINTGTVGVGAPVVSTAENVAAASLTATALLAPALVLLLLIPIVLGGMWFVAKLRKLRQALQARTRPAA